MGASSDLVAMPSRLVDTEVGPLPSDWKVKRLGELAAFRTGPFGSALHKSDYIDGGIPLINPMHIVDGALRPESATSVSDRAANRLADFRLRRDDIVIGRRGDMGRCAVVRQSHAGWLCGTGSLIIRCFADVDVTFLQRVLTTERVIGLIEGSSVGSTMVNLNQAALARLPIQCPPLDEQRVIAEVLSDVDGLLGVLEALIAKKRAIKQAAMQQLLTGKSRLPGFAGEWEIKQISEFADCTSGGTPVTSVAAYWGGTIRWMNSGELNQKQVTEVSGRITSAGLANSSAKLLPERSVLIGLAGQGKTRGTVAMNLVTLCTNQSIAAVLPNSGFVPEYVYFNLDSRYDELRELSSGGGGRGGLNLKLIKGLRLPFPTVQEQAAIAAVLSDMDAEIAALEARRDKTRAIKQGMMQQLLTGRIRLVRPDAASNAETTTQASPRTANVHFVRSVLAAEIIDRLHEQPTFGHVKFAKMMFLVERLCEVDTGSTYHRKAAGPYDNRALRSIDSQLRTQHWFDARKEGDRYRYLPMKRRGGHQQYFDRYFSRVRKEFDHVIDTFKSFDTEQCEIVATLLAAWSDLLRDGRTVDDQLIVREVLNNWHEAKRRIPEDRWLKALGWMRKQGFVPSPAQASTSA